MAQQEPSTKSDIKEALPQTGQLFHEDVPASVLCKPKILPLKSVTLEKLERMQREGQEAIMEQDAAERSQLQQHSDLNSQT
ncbi:BBSome-interacting protein 1-like [Watersipora subatra]|uniref:BBSome-interacting protein 1-like n=1 Tax=Watersipora subatra TaxID=2589382 RepID=UPI00355AF508